jgi:hypothetical protein
VTVAFALLRLALAAVLVIAATGKLLDRAAFRDALREFQAPGMTIGPLSVVIPVVELAVAAALVPAATARWAAIAAAVLLLVFSAAMARLVLRGEEADCACFGAIAGDRVGPGTLLRNAVLLAVAVVIASAGPEHVATAPLGNLDAVAVAVIVLAVVVAVQALFLVQLFRQNGRLLGRLDVLDARTRTGPAIGDPAPASLGPLDVPVTLLFSDPSCGHCAGLVDAVAERDDVLVLGLDEAREAFAIAGVPAAVAIDADGRVASAPVMGRDEVARLLHLDGYGLQVVRG